MERTSDQLRSKYAEAVKRRMEELGQSAEQLGEGIGQSGKTIRRIIAGHGALCRMERTLSDLGIDLCEVFDDRRRGRRPRRRKAA